MHQRSSSTMVAGVLAITAGVIGLVLLTLVVFPFLEPLGWALVVTITSWSPFRWLHKRHGLSKPLAATIMTLLLLLALVLAVVPISITLAREAIVAVEHTDIDMQALEQRARAVPYIGDTLGNLIQRGPHPGQTLERAQPIAKVAVAFFYMLTNTLFILGVAIFLSFFLFLHGGQLAYQLRTVVLRLGGPPVARLLTTAYSSVVATVYGTIATAIVQSLLAGIGYTVVGAPAPILLGMATLICSLLPFGAPAVYLPVAAYLAFGVDRWQAGLGLAIWGVAVVSVADNILRPFLISHSGGMSIVLIFIGIVGGAIAFGPLGIFLGPTIMALARAVWVDLVPTWIPEVRDQPEAS